VKHRKINKSSINFCETKISSILKDNKNSVKPNNYCSVFSNHSAVIFSLIKANKLINDDQKICYTQVTGHSRRLFKKILHNDYSFFKIDSHTDLSKINSRGKKGLGVVYLTANKDYLSLSDICESVKVTDPNCLVVVDVCDAAIKHDSLELSSCVDVVIYSPKNIIPGCDTVKAGIMVTNDYKITSKVREVRQCFGNSLPLPDCELILKKI
jgi:cystathionine beta-lyase/cystathionine gamma-synthase